MLIYISLLPVKLIHPKIHCTAMTINITVWLAISALLVLLQSFHCAKTIELQNPQAITTKHGAVATDDGRCSIVGTNILKEGGNAVDAAVATALSLGVVGPASSGIGGGAFMLVKMNGEEAHAFDMRDIAPLASSENMYCGNETLKASGSLSIAVPGELGGLYKVWRRHGSLPWARLVQPAIDYAKNGFAISPYLHMEMTTMSSGIFSNPGLRGMFTVNGTLLKEGDVCRNEKLADTLSKIAKYGANVMYYGSVGADLVKDIQKAGGIITVQDLYEYEVKEREVVHANVMGYDIFSMPPPSSGGLGMVLILNILAQYNGIPDGVTGSLGLHRFIESVKNMIAIRMNLGDPDYSDIREIVSNMINPDFAAQLKKTINDSRTYDPGHYGGGWNIIKDHGTAHISVVDSERNAVALTSSVNYHFGSLILSESTGILLNNQMDDFSMPETNVSVNSTANVPPVNTANLIQPKKRPLSSMMPTIILKDGNLKAVMGSSGGLRIIAGTTQVFLNHFAKGMDPLSSILSPRFFHSLIPNVVEYENYTTVEGDHFEVSPSLRAALVKKGHKLQSLEENNNCQIVINDLDTNHLTAVSDPRKGGFPAGY